MARLIPNPLGDTLGRADRTIANVDAVLAKVEATLGKTTDTLAEATEVLGEVRDLLVALSGRLEMLDQVPELATKIDAIHDAVVGGSGVAAKSTKKAGGKSVK